jgi:hypothetical protein
MAMAIDPQDVISPAATLLAALGGVFLGHVLARRANEAERTSAEQIRWREKAASALAQLDTLLDHASPGGLTMNLPEKNIEEATRRLQDLLDRWGSTRAAVAEIAYGHPLEAVRGAAALLIDRTRRIVNADTWYIADVARGVQPDPARILETLGHVDEARELLTATKNTLHAVMKR